MTRYFATKPQILHIIQNNPKITITISLLLYILIGIVSYYFIKFLGVIINNYGMNLIKKYKK